ncbi:cell division protein ZipA C-terminal FtsZ-binding domain-containing protein [Chitinilyticum piscinae]|uniref:Cell division protein ZipA n=1 Tax=Chitinilyticum piscinae TaxID=2866724 RepID=A0A8J7KEG3_9NEIS|nr:cell division protein ZipA C-terminal FtsZ-binding domain-containing protein [Chitinilyticum piscinae]MBE9609504.1 cell division protein FtsZ [Chitinilyticum piscinae]
MTDLQLGSLIVGGTIVAAVYAFNWWQEYRYRKEAGKAFARNQPDVLMDTPKNVVRQGEALRVEPLIDEPRLAPVLVDDDPEPLVGEDDIPPMPPALAARAPQPAPAAPVAPAPAPVRVLSPAAAAAAPVSHAPAFAAVQDDEADAPAELLATSLIDPALDFIAEVHAGEPVSAGEVPPFSGAKRIQVIGRTVQDHWEAVHPHSRSRYSELRIALQLADRQGAVTPEQLNAFTMSVQQFADGIEASVSYPQRSSKLASAQDLDDFCAGVDVLIGLNILAVDRPFPLEKVRVLAEQSGLVRGQDGAFHYRSDSGKTLFTLANQDQSPFGKTSEALTLLFDVPRVAGGLPVFDYLCDFAQSLSGALAGNLVDDNGKPLTPPSIASIRKQLAGIYARMDDRGIAPGSVAALRLFA